MVALVRGRVGSVVRWASVFGSVSVAVGLVVRGPVGWFFRCPSVFRAFRPLLLLFRFLLPLPLPLFSLLALFSVLFRCPPGFSGVSWFSFSSGGLGGFVGMGGGWTFPDSSLWLVL